MFFPITLSTDWHLHSRDISERWNTPSAVNHNLVAVQCCLWRVPVGNCKIFTSVLLGVYVTYWVHHVFPLFTNNQGGGSRSTIVARWTTDQAIDPAPGAWFITEIHLISLGCPRSSISLHCMQNRGLKHLIHSNYILMQVSECVTLFSFLFPRPCSIHVCM